MYNIILVNFWQSPTILLDFTPNSVFVQFYPFDTFLSPKPLTFSQDPNRFAQFYPISSRDFKWNSPYYVKSVMTIAY